MYSSSIQMVQPMPMKCIDDPNDVLWCDMCDSWRSCAPNTSISNFGHSRHDIFDGLHKIHGGASSGADQCSDSWPGGLMRTCCCNAALSFSSCGTGDRSGQNHESHERSWKIMKNQKNHEESQHVAMSLPCQCLGPVLHLELQNLWRPGFVAAILTLGFEAGMSWSEEKA